MDNPLWMEVLLGKSPCLSTGDYLFFQEIRKSRPICGSSKFTVRHSQGPGFYAPGLPLHRTLWAQADRGAGLLGSVNILDQSTHGGCLFGDFGGTGNQFINQVFFESGVDITRLLLCPILYYFCVVSQLWLVSNIISWWKSCNTAGCWQQGECQGYANAGSNLQLVAGACGYSAGVFFLI